MNKFCTVKQFDGLLVMCQMICDGELSTETFTTIREKYKCKIFEAGMEPRGSLRDTIFSHMKSLREMGAVKDAPGDRFKFYKSVRVICFAKNRI